MTSRWIVLYYVTIHDMLGKIKVEQVKNSESKTGRSQFRKVYWISVVVCHLSRSPVTLENCLRIVVKAATVYTLVAQLKSCRFPASAKTSRHLIILSSC